MPRKIKANKKQTKKQTKNKRQKQKQSVNIKVNIDNSRKTRTNPRQQTQQRNNAKAQPSITNMNPPSQNNNNDLLNRTIDNVFKQTKQINDLTSQIQQLQQVPRYYANKATQQYPIINDSNDTQTNDYNDDSDSYSFSSSIPNTFGGSNSSFSVAGPSSISGFSSIKSTKSKGGEKVFDKGPEDQVLIPDTKQDDEEDDEEEIKRLTRKENIQQETKKRIQNERKQQVERVADAIQESREEIKRRKELGEEMKEIKRRKELVEEKKRQKEEEEVGNVLNEMVDKLASQENLNYSRSELEKMNVAELKNLATSLNIPYSTDKKPLNKNQIIDNILENKQKAQPGRPKGRPKNKGTKK